jgi:hypothetical protein
MRRKHSTLDIPSMCSIMVEVFVISLITYEVEKGEDAETTVQWCFLWRRNMPRRIFDLVTISVSISLIHGDKYRQIHGISGVFERATRWPGLSMR